MSFLIFSQLPKSVFRPNFPGKHFSENQAKFSFDWKVFSVDQLSNGKQTQGSLNKHSQKEKHFPGNYTKIFFNRKVFSIDQLF
jgi:uncharacterized protein YaiI (UPF0178 family)